MSTITTTAERLAFGRPMDPARDRAELHLVPRPGTALFGRLFLAAIFLVSGIAKLADPLGAVAYMNGVGVPAAETLVWFAGIAEVMGGASLAFGILARLGALGLIVFLVVTTGFFHAFWTLEGAERTTQMVQFMKNLAIAGGLFLLVAHGPGHYSVDYLRRRPLEA